MDEAARADDASRGGLTSFIILSQLTLDQLALANQPWQEYTTKDGRKYWYNKESRQSSWEMPEVYKDALAQSAPAAKPAMP